MANTKCLPSIVYLNKMADVWMRDASQWAANRGWKEGVDYYEIISEVAYFTMLLDGRRDNEIPVYFVTEIITEHA